MAQAELNPSIEALHGKMDPQAHVIMRQKKYRSPNGAILREGVQETYTIAHPRDFNRTPPKGNERKNMRNFGDASLRASEIIRAGKYSDDELAAMTPEQRTHVLQLRDQLEDLRKRFYAQFKRPDPEAPFEKKTDPNSVILRRKQYSKLDNFIQAIVREQLKQQ